MSKCKVYIACKMTNLFCDEMIEPAQEISNLFYEHGLDPYHPVLKEGLPNKHIRLKERTVKEMTEIWAADKAAIKNALVIVDTAPELYSAGVKEEMGKARYRDWKLTIAIYPPNVPIPHITQTERDFATHSELAAAQFIRDYYGTRWKRMKWRLPIYFKHILDISPRKIYEFFR